MRPTYAWLISVAWTKDRAHFFALSARLMRRILVDIARAKGNQKRGAGAQRISFANQHGADLVAVDEVLALFATADARKAQVVELRFFGGLTLEETAEFMSISPATVKRYWAIARAWLARELDGSPPA